MISSLLKPITGYFSSVPKESRKGLVSFYSLSAIRGDGETQKMEDFRGKVVYATNVASK